MDSQLERKRTQPIVIAHESRAPAFASGTNPGWNALSRLTNEGGGNAFNVRFGIELRGVRFPFRIDDEDSPSGYRQRVVRVGEDQEGVDVIRLGSLDMWNVASLKQDGKLHESRMYWARYENASGKTWETRNPAERSAKLDIRRVWVPWFREWRENRRRKQAVKHGSRTFNAIQRESARMVSEREATQEADKPAE